MEELTVSRSDDRRGARGSARVRRHYATFKRLVLKYPLLIRTLHRTLLSVADHDCLSAAQSTAYAAIVALFPGLIVAAAVIGLLPDTAPVRFQAAAFFDRVLPPGVSPLLDAAFEISPAHTHSVRALISAGVVSFVGASNVIATLMEGLRRARELPDKWSFWQRRRRSFELVPLSLVPLAVVSLLLVFGHALTGWLVSSLGPEVRGPIYVISLLLRWTIAFGASVGVIALLYRLGVLEDEPPAKKRRNGRAVRMQLPGIRNEISFAPPDIRIPRRWGPVLPGAIVATALWFLSTLLFGWYVTRFANYSEVYGPLGVGIALLVWLYIISLSVLCGAEFNAQLDLQLQASEQSQPAPRVIAETDPTKHVV